MSSSSSFLRVVALIGIITAADPARADKKAAKVDPKADELLEKMAAEHKLDVAIDFGRYELDLDASAADYSDPYPTPCHHLAFRGNETDSQLWIEDGPRPLPCRYLITSKKVKESPQHTIELHDWNIDPTLPASTFVFTPPPDATKIDFLRRQDPSKKIGKR